MSEQDDRSAPAGPAGPDPGAGRPDQEPAGGQEWTGRQEPQTWAGPQPAGATWYGSGPPATVGHGGGYGPPGYPAGQRPWGGPAAGSATGAFPTVGYPASGLPTAGTPPTALPPAGAPPTGLPPAGAPFTGLPPAGTPPTGLPAVGPPARSGGRSSTAVLMVALMVVSAVAGGAVGAWIYAQADGAGGGQNPAGVTVVDAPQLDYTSLASIASQVGPSVVQIRAGEGSGSGVVMSGDGYILTNAHVVAVATGSEVSVRFSNGETASASIVGADERSDIAVVRVRGAAELSPATLGDSDQALVGDTVLAIGSPLGFQGSVTQGILSARDRTLPVGGGAEQRRSLSGLLQTDASINPGNSGGPLVNLAGEVIGINTAIATDGAASGFLGLGFAVPSNRASDVAEQLIAGEQVRHAYLGVSVTTVEEGGALIGEIAPGSPAEQAGLREGDIVVRVNNQPVADSSDLVNMVQSSVPGDTLSIEYERGGTRQTTTVTLAEIDE